MSENKNRKVTLLYRAETPGGAVTITSDRNHALRSGKITRIYRSKKQAVPKLTACEVPKGTAPWEIYSELEPLETMKGDRLEYQLTDLGQLGQLLLNWYELGEMWDKQIIIVPSTLVPKKEKSFGSAEGGAS